MTIKNQTFLNPSKDIPIFVTGGTGLVGSYLLRYLLEQGFSNIKVLKRSSSPMSLVEDIADRVEWIEGDLLDIFVLEDSIEKGSKIYHCAGLVSYAKKDREALFEVNVRGTANLINAALAKEVHKFIHVSSIAAIGRNKPGQTISEKSKWERSPLNTNYAISKYQGEMEVWRGAAEGLPVAVVNPAMIFGSGKWHEGPTAFFKKIWAKIYRI